MHKEERIGNCLSYLNKIYSLSKDLKWHEPYEMFGLKITDRTARRGYRVQSYNEIYNVAIRIGKPLLVKLGIIETKKINNKGVYRWNGGKPSKEMVELIFKTVEAKEYDDNRPDSSESNCVKKEVIHEVIVEKELTNDDYLKKIFAEITEVKTELLDLKSRNVELTKVIAELRHNDNITVEILNMITKGIMDIGDHNKNSEEARVKNFNLFKKQMVNLNAINLSMAKVTGNNHKLLLGVDKNSKTILDEIIDMRDKKTLKDILYEHQEKLKTKKVEV